MIARPSVTAVYVAHLRAVHQLMENGAIFSDPYAVALSGKSSEEIKAFAQRHPQCRPLSLFLAARSRFAEDNIASAVSRGLRQVVVLGAGLDTFGLRNPHAGQGVRVFEVDQPGMQEWKRTRLGKANLKIPEELRFVAVDLERQELLGSLGNAGVRLDEPTFFTWLGVVPYLTPEAVTATLTSIAGVPKAEVVFDYGQPPEAFPLERRAGYLASLASTAAAGEPWRSFFQPTELATKLSQLGFAKIEDLGARELALRYAREPGPVEEAYHMAHFRVKEPTTIHLRPPPPQLMV